MNGINPNKLRLSKWTATWPQRGEKHFMVTGLLRDADENVVGVTLEAVLIGREFTLPWRTLKDDADWRTGWRY